MSSLHDALGNPLMYTDKNGWPIDIDKYVELMSDPDYPTVGLDEIGGGRAGGYRITTVWTGNGFETIVFAHAPEPGELDEVEDLTRRHDTLMQAKAGHLRAVRAVEQMEATFQEGTE